ncbi:hypothetical protein GCK72_000203 [Caenorhabditis remanei]|uniref:Ion transport domain-containing protein n=1 Tax=Caenorhabditis remanei TaxID=31234 RepID=A0A6A5HMJ4_CAERE|nr:hypothetical protein GCK72_000203 [Caenorhabditis remanei]KAF1768391.1 hypothetical protein GCK72_000203 [Caenorhabditis remanei]
MSAITVDVGEPEEAMELIPRNGPDPLDVQPPAENPSHPDITLDFCNKRTKSFVNEKTGTKKFVFDYTGTAFKNGVFAGKSSWKVLEELLTAKKINVIRTPFILNYVNQKLVDCAWFYALHVFAALIIFICLFFYIVSPQRWNQIPLLLALWICLFSLIFKGQMKLIFGKLETASFIIYFISYIVNLITHFLTLMYVYAKFYYSYDDQDTAWKISVIWIPTLITFSFAFLLVMEGSTTPWQSLNQKLINGTVEASYLESLFSVFQAIVKTSSMMLGEVDANDILNTKKWIASILVLIFEVFTIIILMNLILSLAVDDVKELIQEAKENILKIKVKYLIEVLQLNQAYFNQKQWIRRNFSSLKVSFHTKAPQNVLILTSDNKYGYSNCQFENVNWEIIPDKIQVYWLAAAQKWFIGLDLNEYSENWPGAEIDPQNIQDLNTADSFTTSEKNRMRAKTRFIWKFSRKFVWRSPVKTSRRRISLVW